MSIFELSFSSKLLIIVDIFFFFIHLYCSKNLYLHYTTIFFFFFSEFQVIKLLAITSNQMSNRYLAIVKILIYRTSVVLCETQYFS